MLELAPVSSLKAMRPTIAAEPTAGGHLLKQGRSYAFWVALFIGGVIALAAGIPLGINFGPLAATAVVAVVVAGVGAIGAWQFMLHRGLHPAELVVDRWPVAPGEPVTLRFRQRLKTQLYVRELVPNLRCKEEARYRVGTDTRTVSRVACDLPLERVIADTASDELAAEWTVTVPADAPPSFHASNNKIEWTLEVKVVIDGYPDACPTFPLLVAPNAAEARR